MSGTDKAIMVELIAGLGRTLEALSDGCGIADFQEIHRIYVTRMQPLVDRLAAERNADQQDVTP
jgi:hypothetical protein